jgi:hypothetical protein
MSRTRISAGELLVIKNKEFLQVKARALANIDVLLSETQIELQKVLYAYDLPFPLKTSFKTGKISKGENYLGLPYRVLDYPAEFSKENIFAFRTMFWWGNFFSVTIHLEGDSLEFYRKKIIDRTDVLIDKQIYIAVGDSPWQYHFEPNNYIPLTANPAAIIQKHPFLKLSKKMNLENWQTIPAFSAGFLDQILRILCN